MGTQRQTHTDVALFALWLEKNSQELRQAPRTAEAVQRLYSTTKASGAGMVGLHAIKKLSMALEIPLAKPQRKRHAGAIQGVNSKRTDRIIKEMKDLSEKLQALATHVLALTDDVQTVDGMSLDQFGITEGLKSLVDRQSDPAAAPLQEKEPIVLPTPTGTVPKWGVDAKGRPQA